MKHSINKYIKDFHYSWNISWNRDLEIWQAVCNDFQNVCAFGITQEIALEEGLKLLEDAVKHYMTNKMRLPFPTVLTNYKG